MASPGRPAYRWHVREAILLTRGSVTSFNDLSGHGFIAADEGGVDLWVHERNIVSVPATLRVGERVEFDERQAGMGPEAINVRSLTQLETAATVSPRGASPL
jgi:cold shock CspA family protein